MHFKKLVVLFFSIFILTACDVDLNERNGGSRQDLDDTGDGARITITFETNTDDPVQPLEGAPGDSISLPRELNKEGHQFMGWYLEADFNTRFEQDTMPDTSQTLYARYEPLSYELTINIEQHVNFTDVFINDAFKMMLDEEGKLYCWGNNEHNRAAFGACPTHTDDGNGWLDDPVKDVFTWQRQAFVITEDNQVYAWGMNTYGTLGTLDQVDRSLFTNVTSQFDLKDNETIVYITGSNTNTYALTSEGTVYAWGRASEGALGMHADDTMTAPVDITGQFRLESDESIDMIQAAEARAYALSNHHKLYAWGRNTNGELNGEAGRNIPTPTDVTNAYVKTDASIMGIITGLDTLYVLTSNQQLCINQGQEDQIQCAVTPFDGEDEGTSVKMWANTNTLIMMGRVADGDTLYAWGDNTYGLIGDASTDRYVDIEILNTPPAFKSDALAMSDTSACSIRDEGSIYCWGRVAHETNETVFIQDINQDGLRIHDDVDQRILPIDEGQTTTVNLGQTFTTLVPYGSSLTEIISDLNIILKEDIPNLMPADHLTIEAYQA